MVITDNGRQFESKEFTNLLRDAGSEHRKTPPYSPQCNPVERVNRVLKTMIAQYTADNHRHWDRWITEVVFAYNTAKHESTGFTPAFLNYGRELNPPAALYGPPDAPPRDLDQTDTRLRHEQITHLQDTLTLARHNQARASEGQKKYFNLRHRDWHPAIGSHVMRREHHLSSAAEGFAAKLAPKFAGPYRIIKFMGPNIVLLKDNNNRSSRAHVKDIKPCEEIDKSTNPEAKPTRARTRARKPHSRTMDDLLEVHLPELQSPRQRQLFRDLFGDSSDEETPPPSSRRPPSLPPTPGKDIQLPERTPPLQTPSAPPRSSSSRGKPPPPETQPATTGAPPPTGQWSATRRHPAPAARQPPVPHRERRIAAWTGHTTKPPPEVRPAPATPKRPTNAPEAGPERKRARSTPKPGRSTQGKEAPPPAPEPRPAASQDHPLLPKPPGDTAPGPSCAAREATTPRDPEGTTDDQGWTVVDMERLREGQRFRVRQDGRTIQLRRVSQTRIKFKLA